MNVLARESAPTNAYPSHDLRDFIALIERDHPEELLRIGEEINPGSFEATAILANLEQKGLFPMVLFERPVNQLGQVAMPLLTNIYASRKRCALALGLEAHQDRLELSLEYSRREERRFAPTPIAADVAPVKQVIKIGDAVDLRELPIVRHHGMDPAPYIDMTPVMRDPDKGQYNVAFLR